MAMRNFGAVVERVKRLDRLYLEADAASTCWRVNRNRKLDARLRQAARYRWRKYQAACKSRQGMPRN